VLEFVPPERWRDRNGGDDDPPEGDGGEAPSGQKKVCETPPALDDEHAVDPAGTGQGEERAK
jgi:hypothetical protein